jgi:hypothetical protein
LRNADDVALGEQQRGGLVLDQGGGDVFFFSEGAKDGSARPKSLKSSIQSLSCATGARTNATDAERGVRDIPRGQNCQFSGMSENGLKISGAKS